VKIIHGSRTTLKLYYGRGGVVVVVDCFGRGGVVVVVDCFGRGGVVVVVDCLEVLVATPESLAYEIAKFTIPIITKVTKIDRNLRKFRDIKLLTKK